MKSVRVSISILCAIIVGVVAVTIGTVSLVSLNTEARQSFESHKTALWEGYDNSVKFQVQNVVSLLQGVYDSYQKGQFNSEKEAQEYAKKLVKTLRYNDAKDGYFWIDDTSYTLVAHPILEDKEGNNRHDTVDQNGVYLIQAIIDTATSKPEGGFNEFYFTKADGVTVAPKRAFSMLFKPWGWIVSTGNYIDDIDTELSVIQTQMQQKIIQTTILITLCMIMLIVAAVIIAIFSAGIFTKPLFEIKKLAERLADYDFSSPINVKAKNEFGDTADSLNKAQEHIKVLIGGTIDISRELTNVVENLTNISKRSKETTGSVSTAIDKMAIGAKLQSEATLHATKTTSIMGNSIKTTVEDIEHLNCNAKFIVEASQTALDTLTSLSTINHDVSKKIEAIGAQTEATNKSAQAIKTATAIINSISEETNLLSLNASIEAARAGEAGRGFAVVASQIQTLSEQSSKSVKTINQTLNNLLNNSNKEVEIMYDISNTIKEQNRKLDETQKMFDEVHNGINQSIHSIEEIATMSTELDQSKKNIIDLVQSLSTIAVENTATTQETNVAAIDLSRSMDSITNSIGVLNKVVNALENNVSTFKV